VKRCETSNACFVLYVIFFNLIFFFSYQLTHWCKKRAPVALNVYIITAAAAVAAAAAAAAAAVARSRDDDDEGKEKRVSSCMRRTNTHTHIYTYGSVRNQNGVSFEISQLLYPPLLVASAQSPSGWGWVERRVRARVRAFVIHISINTLATGLVYIRAPSTSYAAAAVPTRTSVSKIVSFTVQ